MSRVHPLAPVVAVDIDGTLGDYHQHFWWFTEMYLQEPVRITWRPRYRGEFSEALGLDKRTYRDIKLAYRQGGMKRSMPVFEGAGEAVQKIRVELGIQVWVTTTRPYNRLDNIDPDTRFWIERNIGRVDGVIFGEEKYHDLVDIVGRDRILGVIDDLPELAEEAQDLGLNVLLKDGEHNRWYDNPREDIVRIDLIDQFYDWVKVWRRSLAN